MCPSFRRAHHPASPPSISRSIGASSSSRPSTTWRSRSMRSGPEPELVEELLQRVCAVLDPAAAAAVTRDRYGGARGRRDRRLARATLPRRHALLAAPIWRELLDEGHTLPRSNGELAGRPYEQLLAAPLPTAASSSATWPSSTRRSAARPTRRSRQDDRRFLDSVAALAGVALDAARQVEKPGSAARAAGGGEQGPQGEPGQEVAAAASSPSRRPCGGCSSWWSGWRPAA